MLDCVKTVMTSTMTNYALVDSLQVWMIKMSGEPIVAYLAALSSLTLTLIIILT